MSASIFLGWENAVFIQVEFVYSKCFPAAKYCMSLACQSICYFILFAPHFWENERCRQSILENHKGQWHQVVDTQTGFWLWDETRFCFLLLSQHVQGHSASSFCSPGCKQRAKYTVCWKCMNKLIDCARLGWQKRIWKWTHWIHLLLLLHQCSLRWFRTRHQLKQHSVRRSALLSTCLTAPTVYVVSRCWFVSTRRPKNPSITTASNKKNPKTNQKNRLKTKRLWLCYPTKCRQPSMWESADKSGRGKPGACLSTWKNASCQPAERGKERAACWDAVSVTVRGVKKQKSLLLSTIRKRSPHLPSPPGHKTHRRLRWELLNLSSDGC